VRLSVAHTPFQQDCRTPHLSNPTGGFHDDPVDILVDSEPSPAESQHFGIETKALMLQICIQGGEYLFGRLDRNPFPRLQAKILRILATTVAATALE